MTSNNCLPPIVFFESSSAVFKIENLVDRRKEFFELVFFDDFIASFEMSIECKIFSADPQGVSVFVYGG